MDDFAPPSGPPPPKVPEGWKAIWNTQYNEWFYVNIYTKKSQWEKPNEPIYPPGEAPDVSAPHGAPPSYGAGNAQPIPSEKTGLSSNNPYATSGVAGGAASQSHDTTEDERLARQLQAEEDARVQGRPLSTGAANTYYGNAGQQPGGAYAPGQSTQAQPDPYTGTYDSTTDKGKHKSGLAGKASSLLNKLKSSGSSRPGSHAQVYGGRPAHGYGHQGYYPPHGPPMMGGGGMMGGGRRPGMGPGGAMALGGIGGLAGGALIGSALAGDDGGDGGGYGGDDGGDYGGGDFGGGDMGGGDFGGGDFGGGD